MHTPWEGFFCFFSHTLLIATCDKLHCCGVQLPLLCCCDSVLLLMHTHRHPLLLLSCGRRLLARSLSWRLCAAAGSAGCASAGTLSRRLWAVATCTAHSACPACPGARCVGSHHRRSSCSASWLGRFALGVLVAGCCFALFVVVCHSMSRFMWLLLRVLCVRNHVSLVPVNCCPL